MSLGRQRLLVIAWVSNPARCQESRMPFTVLSLMREPLAHQSLRKLQGGSPGAATILAGHVGGRRASLSILTANDCGSGPAPSTEFDQAASARDVLGPDELASQRLLTVRTPNSLASAPYSDIGLTYSTKLAHTSDQKSRTSSRLFRSNGVEQVIDAPERSSTWYSLVAERRFAQCLWLPAATITGWI